MPPKDPHGVWARQFRACVINQLLFPGNIQFYALALTGEAGEFANVVKKMAVSAAHPEYIKSPDKLDGVGIPPPLELRDMAVDELSDVLFFVQACAEALGVTLQDLMRTQGAKIEAMSEKLGREYLK